MIQILDAFLQENNYSSIVQFTLNNELIKLRVGILQIDFGHLKRILEFRPFENTGVAPYKYYFVGSYQVPNKNEDIVLAKIKVEQLNMHKQFDFKLSKTFMANMFWFQQLKDKAEVLHLIIT